MKYIAIFLIITVSCAFAISESAGTAEMTFLKMAFSPRDASLGNATVGFADGPHGMFANPAGIAFEKKLSVASSYNRLYVDINAGDIVAQKDLGVGHLGIGARFVSYGEMDETDASGNVIGSFSSSDIAVSAAFAREIVDDLAVGISPFFAITNIADYSAYAVGADFGLLYRFDRGRGRAGIAVKNAGALFSDSNVEETLPLTACGGASYRLQGLPLYFMSQLDYSVDSELSGGFGIEIIQFKPLYVRAGYRIRPRISGELAEGEELNGLSGGFGLEFDEFHVDYSLEHYGVLGLTHKFGLAYDGF